MRLYLEVITVNADLRWKAGLYYFKELHPSCLSPSSISSGKCVLLYLLSTALRRDAMEIKQLEDTTLEIATFFTVDDKTPMTASLICPEGTSVTVCRLGEAQSHSPSFAAGVGPRRKTSGCMFRTGRG